MGAELKSYWNVLYTRPRAEKKAALELSALGAQVYCPTIEVLSQWSDRKNGSKSPHSLLWYLSKKTHRIAFYFLVKTSKAEWLLMGKNQEYHK